MHLLYVRAQDCGSDIATIHQLAHLTPATNVRPAQGVDAAISILRNEASENHFDGLVISPGLDDAALLSLVHEIWRRGPLVTLIAVVLDLAHSLRAFDAGADAVLLLVNGSLANPEETLQGLERRSSGRSTEAEPLSPAGETSANGSRVLVDLSTFRKYFAKPAPRGPIAVDIVRSVDDELVDAFARLVPQLSSSAEVPGSGELDEIIKAASTTLIVARDDRAIVGMLTLHTFRAATGIHAWIQDLVVDKDAKGCGVSELLTREAVRVGVEQGARTAELTSRPSHVGAGRLYERIGFERRQTHLYRYRLSG
jgi:ribosomal protein S18 acetylase RimI-like enzyme